MLTVGSLVAECGLELAAGANGGDRPVRWVHISELEDPTPWLSGGELLLTTGIALTTPARQRRFVSLLSERGVAGLGLGVGFDHKKLPKGLVEAARERDLPLFVVPYEMPFIAITERAAAKLVNEQYDVLERSTKVHERLERLVIEGRGLDEMLASVASAIGGAAVVQDSSGRELARHPDGAGPGDDATTALGEEVAARHSSGGHAAFSPSADELSGRALSVAVPGGRGGTPVAWLTVITERPPLTDFDRLCARQAAIVIGLELMRERVVRETERRLAGDLLADALGGRLESEELRGRLRPFGIGAEAAVLVFELEDPASAERALEQALAEAGISALVATSAAGGSPLLCAVVDAAGNDPPRTRSARRPAARLRLPHCAAGFTRHAVRSRRPRSATATPRT
jgi:purine catabolism regulator